LDSAAGRFEGLGQWPPSREGAEAVGIAEVEVGGIVAEEGEEEAIMGVEAAAMTGQLFSLAPSHFLLFLGEMTAEIAPARESIVIVMIVVATEVERVTAATVIEIDLETERHVIVIEMVEEEMIAVIDQEKETEPRRVDDLLEMTTQRQQLPWLPQQRLLLRIPMVAMADTKDGGEATTKNITVAVPASSSVCEEV
jgi:hypothetical protein